MHVTVCFCVCVFVCFLCACDHVFTDFVTVIVRLGTGVMCKCTCVNDCSREPAYLAFVLFPVFARDGSGVLYRLECEIVYPLSVALLL